MGKRGRPPHPDILTPREWQVLDLIRQDLTNEQIAHRLDISPATAKYHVSEILSKLAVTTREEAAAWQPPAARPWWERAVAPLGAIVRRLGHLTLTKAAIAVGTLAALAGLLAVLLWSISDRDDEHQAVAQNSSSTESATSVVSRSPAPTPSPTPVAPELGDLAFAYVALDGTVWLAADGRSRQVISESLLAGPDFARPASNVKWSPDGRRLAYLEPSLPPQGSPPAGTALWVLDPASSARILLDDSVLDFDWMRTGERIYYVRAPSESWVADLPSGGKAKIGDNHVFWSHDETRFVLTGRIGEYDPARPWESIALFLGTADGAAQRLVDWAGASDWLDPWSPDDRLLAYYKEQHGGSALVGDICTWDLLTSKEICLGEFTSDEFPDWAPLTGRYIFYNYEIDPAGGTFRELFPRPAVLIGWSPDATKVAYVERNPLGQGSQSLIMLDTIAGTSLVLHTSARTGSVHSPGYWARWSPDGRFLAFIGMDDAVAATLYVANATTGEVLRVRAGSNVGELFFAYAPDSSRLLIQDGRYESPSIWLGDANGRNLIKVTDGYAIGHGPDFAPWRP